MRTVLGILAVLLLAVSSSAVTLWRQLDADRQQIADLQMRLEAAVAAAQVRSSVSSASKPDDHYDRPSVSESSPLPPAPNMPSANSVPRAVQNVATIRTLMASPENQERLRALFRAQLSIQYPDIGKALDLSTEKVNQLFDLLTQQDVNRRSELKSGPKEGETADQAFGRRMQSSETELASLLGSKYPKWQEYRKEIPTRQQVRDLSAVLNAGGIPLTDARTTPLLSALIATQKEIDRQVVAALMQGGRIQRYTPEGNQRLVDTASSYLTQEQLQAYRELLQRQANNEVVALGRFVQPQVPATAP